MVFWTVKFRNVCCIEIYHYICIMLLGYHCSTLDYRMFGRTGEGTFSEVLRCQCLADSKYYACKKMKQRYERCAPCCITECCAVLLFAVSIK